MPNPVLTPESRVGGSDERTLVTDVNLEPFNAVVQVPVTPASGPLPFFWGSGILIGSGHALTAGHVPVNLAQQGTPGPVATAANFGATPDASDIDVISYFRNDYSITGAAADDYALLSLDAPDQEPAGDVVGLIGWVDPADAVGEPIDFLAGFPRDLNDDAGTTGALDDAQIWTASGTVNTAGGGRLTYSQDVDTFNYQSGSGVLTTIGGETLVLGIHTNGAPPSGNNSGVLLAPQDIFDVMAIVGADTGGADADVLPRNWMIGSALADDLDGTYRRDRLEGRGDDDTLRGEGADDELIGGAGTDVAEYSGLFPQYALTDNLDGTFTIDHTGGTGADDTDTLDGVEFVRFGDGFLVPVPAVDGPLRSVSELVRDATPPPNGPAVEGSATLTLPAYMFDGDVNYTFSLTTSDPSIQFNFVYVIDVSGSMGIVDSDPDGAGPRGLQSRLATAVEAYQELTFDLVSQGVNVAAASTFAVVPFESTASQFGPLTPNQANNTLVGLTPLASTNYAAGLAEAATYINGLPSNATDIVYFLSDGFPNVGGDFTDEAADLQSAANDIRVFGVGGAPNLGQLQVIDDDAQVLGEFSDLFDVFSTSGIDRADVDRVEVRLEGTLIETIDAADLVDGPLGLTVAGNISGLEVSATAMNDIEFEVFYTDGRANTLVETVVTTGQDDLSTELPTGELETVLALASTDFAGGGEDEIIIGNELDNRLEGGAGANELVGGGGGDTFVLARGSTNLVDGGAGTDTAEFVVSLEEAGDVRKVGDVVLVGRTASLTDVEFLQFADVRLSTEALDAGAPDQAVTPVLAVAPPGPLDEPDAGADEFAVGLLLSGPAPEAVTLRYELVPGAAGAADVEARGSGEITIAAGETGIDAVIGAVLADDAPEAEEEFSVRLFDPVGATFEGGADEVLIDLTVAANDTVVFVSPTDLDADASFEIEEGSGLPLSVPLSRVGDTSGTLTVEFAVVPGDVPSADGADFGGALPSGSATFAAGDSFATVEIAVADDADAEPDEAFVVEFVLPAGSAADLLTERVHVTILDDDDGGDADGDGVPDATDNATQVPNPDQRDTDGDGYGNVADPDLNNDGFVNAADAAAFAAVFGQQSPGDDSGPVADADFDGDGFVNAGDATVLAALFGGAPGPSFVDDVL